MNASDFQDRFEELSAGRALGDLTTQEADELDLLMKERGVRPDETFDLLAASLEIEALQRSVQPLPEHLTNRLRLSAAEHAKVHSGKIVRPAISVWQRIVRSPLTGWAVAAAVMVFAIVQTREAGPLPPAQAEARLRAEARDLIEREFTGVGNFTQTHGKVVWSDQFQRGYMILTGIPANDPKRAQYQLWIVDPARDADSPVDGGVFDIPASAGPVVIPIVAKLLLNKPRAFVVTLEQPGGVVKSKQEQVVALAKL